MIDLEFFHKQNIIKYFTFHFLPYFIFFIFALLVSRDSPPFITLINAMTIAFYVYFIHVLFHNIPKQINPHLLYHHGEEAETKIQAIFNSLIETVVNIIFFVIFYFIKQLLHVNFIPDSLIFYFGFVYTTTHIINYSLFHLGKNHRNHHTSNNNVCNYGPDVIDKLMGTSCNKNYEDLNHIIANSVIGYFVTCGLYKIPVL
jgi:hypothetical protein